jgi:hypothetical protein
VNAVPTGEVIEDAMKARTTLQAVKLLPAPRGMIRRITWPGCSGVAMAVKSSPQ